MSSCTVARFAGQEHRARRSEPATAKCVLPAETEAIPKQTSSDSSDESVSSSAEFWCQIGATKDRLAASLPQLPMPFLSDPQKLWLEIEGIDLLCSHVAHRQQGIVPG